MQDLIKKAKAVLEENDRGYFTVSSANSDNQIWSFTSVLVAMGWAHLDPNRGLLELERLYQHQMENGLVPHLIFNDQISKGFFPGPELWCSEISSFIPHLPFYALALEYLLNKGGDSERIATLLEKVENSHLFYYQERDPLGLDLIAVSHPYESGMEEAPCWDAPLKRVSTNINYENPPDYESARHHVRLVESMLKNDLGPCEFLVYDPALTTILSMSESALARVADQLGFKTDASERSKKLESKLSTIWEINRNEASYHDGLLDMSYFVSTIGAMFPMLMETCKGDIQKFQESFLCEYGLSTYEQQTAIFDPESSWRGSTNLFVNWMFSSLVNQTIHDKVLKLVTQSGFREHYHPQTGQGLGVFNHSVSASLFLVMFD